MGSVNAENVPPGVSPAALRAIVALCDLPLPSDPWAAIPPSDDTLVIYNFVSVHEQLRVLAKAIQSEWSGLTS